MDESDGVSSTQTAVGSDTPEDTENTTVLVQMEEEKRAIRTMPFVTTLSFVRAVKGKTPNIREPQLRRMTCRRSSLKNGMSRSKTKTFGRDWRGCPGHGKGPWDGLGDMSKTKVTHDLTDDNV